MFELLQYTILLRVQIITSLLSTMFEPAGTRDRRAWHVTLIAIGSERRIHCHVTIGLPTSGISIGQSGISVVCPVSIRYDIAFARYFIGKVCNF